VKAAYWAIFDTGDVDTEPGPDLVRIVQARIARRREQLTAYLRFPAQHHHRMPSRHPWRQSEASSDTSGTT
jgi:putative transposase